LLYPLAALLGRVSIARLAHALAPAQIVAASTRSSLASLPALIEGAERRLGLPGPVTGLVLPLAVATFKLNRTVSSTAKLMFLAHVYGIPLDPGQIGVFVATVLLISFSTPGIPSAGTLTTLPVYLSFGIPIEGILVLNAVDAIPDIFKTVLNVTGDMSAAAMVARFAGTPAVAPSPQPLPVEADA
jgi:proton glutamate symport protein